MKTVKSLVACAALAACPALAAEADDADAAADQAPAPATAGTFGDEILVTARVENASINGIAIDPLRLPQNVRLLDGALISDLGAVRLDDLLDLSGSVARQNNFGGVWDNYAIRGFAGDINGGPDLLINRFNANRGFNAARDTATIELFQVLKGPASALSGKGEPGGSINIVTRAPFERFGFGAELQGGSFGHYRGAIDVGGGVGGGLAARFIAAREENDGFRDFAGNDRLLVAPSLSFRPGEGLHLLYQFEYSLVNTVFDRGVVALERVPGSGVLDGRALPRERFLGEPEDGKLLLRSSQHQASFTAALAPGLALEGGVQYRQGLLEGTASEVTSVVGTEARRRRQFRGYDFDDLSGRAELAARGSLFGIGHQFRVGADAYRFEIDSVIRRATTSPLGGPYAIDVLNPVYGRPLPAMAPQTDTNERQEGYGIYAQDLVTLGDRLSLLLGLRHDRIEQTVVNNRTGRVTEQSPSVTTPRAAIAYRLGEHASLYAGWGRSFRFNQGTGFAGDPFPPERGDAYEAGVKLAGFDGRLNATLSAFQIEKTNVLATDPANPGFSAPIGRARSRGLEADVNFRASRRFDVTAVYALIDAEVLADDPPNPRQAIPAGTALSNIPRHSGSLFAQWRSSEAPAGFVTLGGGVTYVGAREGTPTGTATVNSGSGPRPAVFRLPAYATARAHIGYQLTPEVSAQLMVENLTDAYYLASSFNENWVMPGTPRSIRLRLRANF
ncbi:MAG: TonB-dependent siderophore receptor [Allosphingosinicella sp.]|uniref:TonB-dependent siderophore receptor n=1 Tax=Allosphingosinicella sp. TaxID=2823234 RepID=UPI00393E8CAF